MTIPILVRPAQFKTYALGVPGAMSILRVPDGGIAEPLNRGEVQHDLISGGSAVTRRWQTRRTWAVNFSGCTPDTADLLVAYYSGVKGNGPFCFVDPAWRNALTTDASTFGSVLGATQDWIMQFAGQTLMVNPVLTPPVGAPNSAVAVWHGAGSSSHIGTGTSYAPGVPLPDPIKAPPYLPSVVTSISVYARSVSGTPGVTLRARACLADGTTVSTGTQGATLSSAFQRISTTLPASLTAQYITLDIQCTTAAAPDLYFAGAAVEYGVSTPSAWVVGVRNSPRSGRPGNGRGVHHSVRAGSFADPDGGVIVTPSTTRRNDAPKPAPRRRIRSVRATFEVLGFPHSVARTNGGSNASPSGEGHAQPGGDHCIRLSAITPQLGND